MRLIGQHAQSRTSADVIPTHPPTASGSMSGLTLPTPTEVDEPPPDYECAPGPSTEDSNSENVHPTLSVSLTRSSNDGPRRSPVLLHTIELNRTDTGSSSIGSAESSPRLPKPSTHPFRALFQPLLGGVQASASSQAIIGPNVPEAPPDEIYRLPSSGATPDQIRFLESPSNLSRLGVSTSSSLDGSHSLLSRSSIITLSPLPSPSSPLRPASPPPPFPQEPTPPAA